MEAPNLRKLFYQAMKPIMASYGFDKGNFLTNAFQKKGKGGYFEYSFDIPYSYGSWSIDPILCIRSHMVHMIYTTYLVADEETRHGMRYNSTLACSPEEFRGIHTKYHYGYKDLEEKGQIPGYLTYYKDLFEKDALPFFDLFPNIVAMERLVNTGVLDCKDMRSLDTRYGGEERKGITGLILARIVNSPDYEKLKEKYFEFYKKGNFFTTAPISYNLLIEGLESEGFPAFLNQLEKKYGQEFVP